MIPIDFKITNFFLHLFAYFFVAIIIFGELTSATSNERMTTNIIFAGATPIINEKFIWVSLYSRLLALLHSAIGRGEHEKYLFLPLYGNTENSLVTVCAPRID